MIHIRCPQGVDQIGAEFREGGKGHVPVIGARPLTCVTAPDQTVTAQASLLFRCQRTFFLGQGRETAVGVQAVGAQCAGGTGRSAFAAVHARRSGNGSTLQRQIGEDGAQKEPGAPGGQNRKGVPAPKAQSSQGCAELLRKRRVVHKRCKTAARMGRAQGGAHPVQPPGHGGVVILAPGVEGEISRRLAREIGKGGHIDPGGGRAQRLRPRQRGGIHMRAHIFIGAGPPGRGSRGGKPGIRSRQGKPLLSATP